ncbi:4-hydroxybenzoyl-CoA thioesterase [Kibdelosporangium aridum]|uniref:4-hydroxybenzoyl-CoA thioesterase n=1 Tax=Kibdelosporangium aridum TaxID=2030 RepID=A0A428YTU5_KIBAR|nr:thioesterase family protein [Kibdelosporangium aridum]RSM72989.1 4-hydroxybenzoyl-CoA thioesterase [Kibdelosporangium aridum]
MLEFRDTVRDEWIDYNGHLSEPFYVMVFGFATTAMMGDAGIDPNEGNSLYTVEAHVRYLREVAPEAELKVTTVVIDVGAKKVRFCHEMYVGDTLVATEELLALHVRDGKTAPFPEHARERLRHHLSPAPDYAGRAIS